MRKRRDGAQCLVHLLDTELALGEGEETGRDGFDFIEAQARAAQLREENEEAARSAAAGGERACAIKPINHGAHLSAAVFALKEGDDAPERTADRIRLEAGLLGKIGDEIIHGDGFSLRGSLMLRYGGWFYPATSPDRKLPMLDAVLKSVDNSFDGSLERLFDLMRIDSISTDPAHAKSCQKAAEWLVGTLSELEIDASARQTGGHPIVVGHAGDKGPNVLFYGHYDVQPVDPLSLWETPPFEPRVITRPDGSRYIAGRGAADDKGQLMTFVEALRAWKSVTGSLPVRVTLLLEGEEESGGPSLRPFLEASRAELAADVALICDTGMWDRTTPAITVSLRGLVGQEVTIHAAGRDLHSGLYGGAARNPIHVLAGILAEMHDADGRVTIPSFYDGVAELPESIRKQWGALDFDASAFLRDVGLSEPAGESGRSVLEQIWARPTAEVNGIFGGYTQAGFKTVIPATASAKVSFRLVGDQNPEVIARGFRTFVQARLPSDCRATFAPHGASPAQQLPLDGPWLPRVEKALADEWGKSPVLMGGGGSIPVVGDFSRILGLSSVMVGFGLDDDRIHSPNEKYELSSYRGGIRSWARILAALAEGGPATAI